MINIVAYCILSFVVSNQVENSIKNIEERRHKSTCYDASEMLSPVYSVRKSEYVTFASFVKTILVDVPVVP